MKKIIIIINGSSSSTSLAHPKHDLPKSGKSYWRPAPSWLYFCRHEHCKASLRATQVLYINESPDFSLGSHARYAVSGTPCSA